MAFGKQELEEVVLHLPAALRDRAEEMASRESLSFNLFVVMAVAEKLQRLQLQHCLEITERDELRNTANPTFRPFVH